MVCLHHLSLVALRHALGVKQRLDAWTGDGVSLAAIVWTLAEWRGVVLRDAAVAALRRLRQAVDSQAVLFFTQKTAEKVLGIHSTQHLQQ